MSIEMERWLDFQNPSLRKSLTAVTLDKPALHLSSDSSIKIFTPRIPKSLYDGEDQTIARISVSGNIIDTLVGASWNFEKYDTEINKEQTSFTIYALDVRDVIRPTKKLTQECCATGEFWIVNDRMSNYEVRSRKVAELCLSWVRQDYDSRDKSIYLSFVLEVEETLALTERQILEPGFYTIGGIRLSDLLCKKRDLSFDLNKATRDAFLEGKYNLVVI